MSKKAKAAKAEVKEVKEAASGVSEAVLARLLALPEVSEAEREQAEASGGSGAETPEKVECLKAMAVLAKAIGRPSGVLRRSKGFRDSVFPTWRAERAKVSGDAAKRAVYMKFHGPAYSVAASSPFSLGVGRRSGMFRVFDSPVSRALFLAKAKAKEVKADPVVKEVKAKK